MENSTVNKLDPLDNRTATVIPSSGIPYPSNVAMCYSSQPPLSSPLADGGHGNQAASNYLVPPAMASPSGCLASQQMYPNYPSPYYRTMLAGSQQSGMGGYYGTILPTGHHSSAFYGTFYNPSSSSVYSGSGQPTLNPMNYYSTSLYMQNHDSVWPNSNQSSNQLNQNKTPNNYELHSSSQLPSCSKIQHSTAQQSSLSQDTSAHNEEQAVSTISTEPVSELCSIAEEPESKNEPDFVGNSMEKPPSQAGTVYSETEESLEKESADESVDEEEEEDVEQDPETSSTFSSTSYDDSYSSDDFTPIENEDILENVPDSILNDTSFGDIEQARQDLVDDDLQCLLCNNFDHLIPRLDIAIKLEPVVGEPISKSSVLLCTQCDLMLERYLSLEKEVQSLQAQIQSMYQNNKQIIQTSKEHPGDIDFEQLSPCHDNQSILNDDFSSVEPNTEHNIQELKSLTVESCSLPADNMLSNHVNIECSSKNTNETKFSNCEECGKPYPDNRTLKRHIKQNHAKKGEDGQSKPSAPRNNNPTPLHCELCSRDFERRSHYVYHMKVHHGTREFKCQVCDKEFVTRGALNTHSRIHSGEKPYVCETCGRGFNVNSNLLAHVPKCTGLLPWKCDQCEKAFATRALQQVHLKIHQGEYAVKCDVCGMGFTKKSHLIAHHRIHTKEKPYQCPTCGKAFASLGNCNSHAKTHADERKFVCEICGKKFARRQALESHLNRHNGVKPFKCDICDKSFHDPSNLTNHKKIHRDEV